MSEKSFIWELAYLVSQYSCIERIFPRLSNRLPLRFKIKENCVPEQVLCFASDVASLVRKHFPSQEEVVFQNAMGDNVLVVVLSDPEEIAAFSHLQVPLFPPKKHIKKAEHHWVEQIDSDGRGTGLSVMQWQAGVKAWCFPNQYGAGNESPLEGYVWRGLCPTPAFEDERQEFLDIIKSDEVKKAVNEEKYNKLLDFISGYM
jgi:hypothetical protein